MNKIRTPGEGTRTTSDPGRLRTASPTHSWAQKSRGRFRPRLGFWEDPVRLRAAQALDVVEERGELGDGQVAGQGRHERNLHRGALGDVGRREASQHQSRYSDLATRSE